MTTPKFAGRSEPSTLIRYVHRSHCQEKPGRFTIYYVSDQGYADGNHFSELYGMLRMQFPKEQYIFQHIRDVDGHFVTRDEYWKRQKI